MGIMDILQQYASGNTPSGDVGAHYDEVSRQVPQQELGGGLAAAFRADSTPPFGQMVGNLFGQSNPQQQAGLLNQLIAAIGPAGLSSVAGGALGRILGGEATSLTPAQASQVSPSDVTAIAEHAEKHDPSVIDAVSSFYAQHPTLVKTIGAVALSAVLGHLRSSR